MKFLMFNFAVIAALFFLFNPDRADLHALADRAYETVGMARDKAESVVAKVTPSPTEAKTVTPSPAPVRQAAAPAPIAPNPETQAVTPAPMKQAALPPPVEAPAPVAAAVPEKALDPAVAQRRAEVLGLDAPAVGPAEEKLMSPEQRRRELFTLAEEMELFYVRRLSR